MRARFPRNRLLPEVAVSALLLVPCFWQSRIQAGDLSSHIYNAWLACEIQKGTVQGLTVTAQWTNVLFDLWLVALLQLWGPAVAQRIAVGAAVLIFAWGAFALVSRVNGRRGWHLMPCIAMLAYGWVFHSGLFNFSLSLGLCLWGLSFLWRGDARGRVVAVILFGVGWLAHALPVLWAAGAGIYLWVAGRVPARPRFLLLVVGAAMVVLMRVGLIGSYPHGDAGYKTLLVIGVDQLWVYGSRYLWVSMGLLLVWALLAARLLEEFRWSELVGGVPFHWLALTSLGIVLIPTKLRLPDYYAPLGFITERMSLVAGVLVCVILGAARPPSWIKVTWVVLAAVYFIFLWQDTRDLNAIEDRLEAAVELLPAGQRVVSAICRPSDRVFSTLHMTSRACLGRCYSYANYEPASRQFRVRALRDNLVVIAHVSDLQQLDAGEYRVNQRDLPLYLVYTCGPADGGVCIRELAAGEEVPCPTRTPEGDCR
jgi:hypothetical protein